MKFHLNYTPGKSVFPVTHKSAVFLIGSCFAENIGQRLNDSGFKTCINPNGILFNPLSIANSLKHVITNQPADESFILERDGLFYSYSHHSMFSSPEKEELIKLLNSQTEKAHQFLKAAGLLIITFGTAFVYRHKQLNATVANCHKQPGETFEKKLLSVDEIVSSQKEYIRKLQEINPSLPIIFTVSPVKYLKDGVEENSLSKATLLLSVSKLVAEYPAYRYFPAYELVNDDLRDYRFYKEDLAHPNEAAIEYVWQKFSESCFNAETQHVNQEILKLKKALNHKHIHKQSLESGKLEEFIANQRALIKKLDSTIEI